MTTAEQILSGLAPVEARRCSLRMLVGLCCSPWLGMPVASAVGASASRELRVVTAPESPAGRQFLQALRARYPALAAASDPGAFDSRRGSPITVAIGPSALTRALDSDLPGPLVSVLTSSQRYRQLLGLDVSAARNRSEITAIYADASPVQQLQLITGLYERRVAVGVLLSEASAYLERPLRQAAGQMGLELLIERVVPGADLVRALTRLSGAQVLLAVPDSTLYTPDTLRAVLESTYRRGLSVVGFSTATVSAGTLATAYSAIDDVVADLSERLDLLASLGNKDALFEPRYPHYWRVAINESVARSLGVSVTDKAQNLGNRPSGRPA